MYMGLRMPGKYMSSGETITLFGYIIPNPLGLAAGFDKNGELPDVVQDYGLGWVEVGSVTLHGGLGNAKPRMFRIEGYDILNRMGLNGVRAELVAHGLRRFAPNTLAVNIAKTNNPDIMGDMAIRDMVDSYKLLKGLGLYTVLNISCPNTADGKTFEDHSALRELLFGIKDAGVQGPLLLKLSPTLISSPTHLGQLLIVALAHGVDGFVLCNTYPYTHPRYGKGGASGSLVFSAMLDTVRFVRARTDKTIIACGGIFTPYELLTTKAAGADFFQAYNGFVRGPCAGVGFAHKILSGYEKITKEAHREQGVVCGS
jgi:dihydroorotate dehydrogenase